MPRDPFTSTTSPDVTIDDTAGAASALVSKCITA